MKVFEFQLSTASIHAKFSFFFVKKFNLIQKRRMEITSFRYH